MSARIVRIVAAALALVGLVVLLNSTPWGIAAFGGIVRRAGGALTGYENQIAYDGAVATLRTIGAILLGVGLLRALELPRQG
ncbi:MAG: hypothetical protein ACYC4R_02175 [Anaerolineae bacterium]